MEVKISEILGEFVLIKTENSIAQIVTDGVEYLKDGDAIKVVM